jgi:hypothetical protein
VIDWATVVVAGCFLLLSGCTKNAAAEVARNACHAAALSAAHSRAVTDCPDTWDDCILAPEIEADLEKSLEECDK